MKPTSTIYWFNVFFAVFIGWIPTIAFGQLDLNMSTTDNTNCNGTGCDYSGPSILINELMMSPTSNDGSLFGGLATQAGEWIELYNPDICDSIDISCYYLGNNTNDGDVYPGGYVIPPGTVIPPSGFAMIRGVNAAPVPAELLVENGGNVVELVVTGDGVCIGGGTRLWFPNAGGWFAFYDNNGVPQDAVSWANQSNIDQNPCVPALPGCNFGGSLPNYEDFPNDRKEYILAVSAADHQGESLRRIPDGGTWAGPGNPTYAKCNDICLDEEFLVCNGTATAEPQGGVAPYTYLWDDFQMQTTQTADRLCAGEYCVIITDAVGDTIQQCITVEDASYAINITDDFCDGDTYTLPNNTTVTDSGNYIIPLQSSGGCDSTITVQLQTYPNYSDTLNPEICENETYLLPDGTEVSDPGTYNSTFQTIHGCDSNVTVNLTVLPPFEIPQDIEICPGTTVELPDGTEVENPGLYEVLISGGSGCDTLYIVNISVFPEIEIEFGTFSDISCTGENDGSISLDLTSGAEPYIFNWSDGQDHGAAASGLPPGDYTVVFSDANGCDADTSFTISEPSTVEITASVDTLICLGSNAELVASATGGTGDFTYHWSHTAADGSVSTVTPDVDSSYSVYATDQNGCSTETLTLDVSVISMDESLMETTAGAPVCQGGETFVSAHYSGAHPPYSYNWSHGLPDGPGPHTVSPDETTTYTVTVTDDCGNEITGQVSTTIWTLPVAEVTENSDISCFGLDNGTAQIEVTNGTPNYTFNWSDGQDHGASAAGLIPGDYSVEVTDANGCETQTSFEIIEPTAVDITASVDTLICLGTDAQLVAWATGGSGDFTYHWSHTSVDESINTVSPDEDSSYSVYATDENGCNTDTVILDVAVITMDVNLIQTSPENPVCEGEEISVHAEYNGSHPPYSYQWSHGLPDGPGPHVVNPSGNTTYTVTVSDDCGNEISGEVPVVIHPLPQAELQNTSDVQCHGMNNGTANILVVNGMPDYSFIWSDGQDHNNSATGLGPGNYSVIIIDSNGCNDSLSFDITEPEPLTINLSSDTLICPGEPVNLNASLTGGIGTIQYNWTPELGNSANHVDYPEENITYAVSAIDQNGCASNTVSSDIEVITMSSNLLETYSGAVVCPGDATTVGATYNGNHPPYTYQWSHNLPDGPGEHEVSPEQTTNYTVTVSDKCGNLVEGEVEVITAPNPIVDLPDIIAEGCADLVLSFSDTVNDPSNHTHVWTINETQVYHGPSLDHTFTEAGVHEIELSVTSFDGCNAANTSPSLVIVLPTPNANFEANPWEAGIDNPEIQFTDQSTGDIETWNWNFGDEDVSADQSPLHTYSDTGTYAVKLVIQNGYGCSDSLSRNVRITPVHNIIIPNAFTPPSSGGDGNYDPNDTSNDIFYPFADYVEEFQMSIFNRWGELIFESTEFGFGWDGTYRGEPCPQDVYVYKIEFVFSDGVDETRVGDITLFR